jgi:hypothetical protein
MINSPILAGPSRPGAPALELRAAAPVSLRPILDGPSTVGTLIGSYPSALYLAFGTSVIGLLGRDAVHVPCGLWLAGELPRVQAPFVIGDGALRLGGVPVTAGRYVQTRVATLPAPVTSASGHFGPRTSASGHFDSRTSASGHFGREWAVIAAHSGRNCPLVPSDQQIDLATDRPSDLQGHLRAVADLEIAAQAGRGPLEPDEARQLLGRGSGLTPSGDDVVAGYLVACHAFGLAAEPLCEFVRAEAGARTTTLSASLLRHAAEGEAIPQVRAFVLALGGAGRAGDIERTLNALLAVGHTSGEALAAGILRAVTTADTAVETAVRAAAVPETAVRDATAPDTAAETDSAHLISTQAGR